MKTILISAGHSDSDPGAVANGRREADVTVEFRNMVSFYLAQMGVKHDLDGQGTQNLPLPIAVKMAKQHQIAVEFHCNASPNKTASGAETLSNADDMAFGASLARAAALAFDIPNRGAKPEDSGHHHRLAFVRVGGVICELFFITNPSDLSQYDRRKWVAAQAVANVIAAEAAR